MRLATLVIALSLTACASGGGSTGMTSEGISGTARQGSTNVITADEIKAQTFQNAWQAVISLRPSWQQVPAFVRNSRISFERLQEIRIEDVKEIRMLSREQARVRFGPDAQQTILVVTK